MPFVKVSRYHEVVVRQCLIYRVAESGAQRMAPV